MNTPQDENVRWLMQTFALAGVDQVLVCPGSRSTPLVQAALALEKSEHWRLRVVLDERQAGFAALGMARAGARPLVITTSGSAVAHLLPACVEAGETGVGLLLLTADRPPHLRDRGAPQTVRQNGLLTAYAHCMDLDLSASIGSAAREELGEALGAWRQGQLIQLNACLDVPLALAPWRPPRAPQSQIIPEDLPAPPEGDEIEPPRPGEKVIVLAGPLAPDPALEPLVGALAQQAVVLAESTSNLASAAQHHGAPLQWDALLRDDQLRAMLAADRVVRLGEWPASKGLQSLLEQAGAVVEAVRGPRYSDPLGQLRRESLLPAPLALRRWLTPEVELSPQVQVWREAWRTADRATLEAVTGLDPSGWERAALIELASELRPGDWLVVGNSMPVRDLDGLRTEALGAVQVLCSRGANGIDGTVAMAWGVAAASQARVRVYLGDSALLHDIGALQLLAQNQEDVRILAVDNGGGAIFDYLPARNHMDEADHVRCFTAPHGLPLAAIAQGFGLQACAVADREALHQAWQGGAHQVVVFQVDRGESLRRHRAWQAAATAAARGALGLAGCA